MTAPTPSGRRPKVALVVGSGGLKCVAALGLWRVLAREGIEVDMFVGCSGGSIYVSAMAFGFPLEESIKRSYDLWSDRFRKKNLRAILQIIAPRLFSFNEDFGLVDDRGVNTALEGAFGDRRIEQAAKPLFIVATDFRTGEKVVLESGRLSDAIRASIAIPLALRPWTIDGRKLVDGGASDPLPIDVAIREGADVILAMGFESAMVKEIATPAALALQASTVTMNYLIRATFAFYNLAHHAEVIPIMPIIDQRVGLSDTHLIPHLIEQGEKAAAREMPYLSKLLAGVETH